MSIAERATREQGIGKRLIGEQAKLGKSDRGVIERKNTVRNE